MIVVNRQLHEFFKKCMKTCVIKIKKMSSSKLGQQHELFTFAFYKLSSHEFLFHIFRPVYASGLFSK